MNENNVVEIYQDNTPSKIAFIRNAWWSNNEFLICESGLYKRAFIDKRFKENRTSNKVPEWVQIHSLPIIPVSINSPYYSPEEKGVFNNIKSGYVEIKFKSALGMNWETKYITYEQYQHICNSVLKRTWMTTGFDERSIQKMLNQCLLDGQTGYINSLGDEMPPFIPVQKIFDKAGYSEDFIQGENGEVIKQMIFLRKGDKKFLVPDDSEIQSVAKGDYKKEFAVKKDMLHESPLIRMIHMHSVSGYARPIIVKTDINYYLYLYGLPDKGKSKIAECSVSNECKPSVHVGNVAQLGSSKPGLESDIQDFNHGTYHLEEADSYTKKAEILLQLLNGGGAVIRDTKSENNDATKRRNYNVNFIMFGNNPLNSVFSDSDGKKTAVLSRGIQLDILDEVIHKPNVSPVKFLQWNETLADNYGSVRFHATDYVLANTDFLKRIYNTFIFALNDHDKSINYEELNLDIKDLKGFEDIQTRNFSFLKNADRSSYLYASLYIGAYILGHLYGEDTFVECVDTLKTVLYSRSDEEMPVDNSVNDIDVDTFCTLKNFVKDVGLNGQNMIWEGYAYDKSCDTFQGDMFKLHEYQKTIALKISEHARNKNTDILGYVNITKPMTSADDMVGTVMLTPAGQARLQKYNLDIEQLKDSGNNLNERYIALNPKRNPENCKNDTEKKNLINQLFYVVKAVNGKAERGQILKKQLFQYADNTSNNKSKTAFFRLDDYPSIFLEEIKEDKPLKEVINKENVKMEEKDVADNFANSSLTDEELESYLSHDFSSMI